jgi:hypothetical protein
MYFHISAFKARIPHLSTGISKVVTFKCVSCYQRDIRRFVALGFIFRALRLSRSDAGLCP